MGKTRERREGTGGEEEGIGSCSQNTFSLSRFPPPPRPHSWMQGQEYCPRPGGWGSQVQQDLEGPSR